MHLFYSKKERAPDGSDALSQPPWADTRLARRRARGATTFEYLMLASFVTLVAVITLRFLGGAVSSAAETSGRVLSQLTWPEGTGASRSGQRGPGSPWTQPGLSPPPAAPLDDGSAPPSPPAGNGDERCSNFISCGWERAKENYEKYPSPLRFSVNTWKAAWDEVSGAFVDAWDFGKALFTDPGSIWDGAKDAWDYAREHPGELLLGLVWDEESQQLWDEGKYDAALGRTTWNVGSYFIPFVGEVKAGARIAKLVRQAAEKANDGRTHDGGSEDPDEPEGDEPDAHGEQPVCDASGSCNRPGESCFAAGTLVHTANGLRAIEEIRTGDEVWSRDADTGEAALRPVQQLFVTPEQPILILSVASDAGREESLRVTFEHPFWTQRGWTAAQDLAPGDSVQLLSGDWVDVVAGESADERVTVYNFEVAGFHTYFVGDQGLWVHNLCDIGEDGKFRDPDVEARYQKYLQLKNRRGQTARDREDWKQASDHMLNGHPTARGNAFNKHRREVNDYPYHEVNLEDGTRVDSYDPKRGLIVERKATDFDAIETSTFERYLDETLKKYPNGKPINAPKYPALKGQTLQGRYVLEVPDSNKHAANRAEFERIARDKGFEIKYVSEGL
jgi:Flp pilus assembly pilin Flp